MCIVYYDFLLIHNFDIFVLEFFTLINLQNMLKYCTMVKRHSV